LTNGSTLAEDLGTAMTDDPVSRRALLAMAGAAAALPLVRPAQAAIPERSEPDEVSEPLDEIAVRLLSPLVAGSRLGPWTVERVLPLVDGAVSVVLIDGSGVPFQLDVCARDASSEASSGPARSEVFEVFLANGGDGALGTHEDHGLAAMALAEVIRANEAHVPRKAFRTLAQRLAAEQARVHV
jgi:hypothetical protein